MNINVAVEYLLWMLIAASAIAVIARRIRIPYTVALVVGGLALGTFHIPFVDNILRQQPSWLTPDVSLVIFLPPLLFEGSLKIQVRQFRENLLPILLFANVGVIAATFIAGLAVHWVLGLPLLVSLERRPDFRSLRRKTYGGKRPPPGRVGFLRRKRMN